MIQGLGLAKALGKPCVLWVTCGVVPEILCIGADFWKFGIFCGIWDKECFLRRVS